MECREVHGHLADLNRGRLEAALAEAVRAHTGQCAACAAALGVEGRVRARIQAEAPRYTAPPVLRARIQEMIARPAARGWAVWRSRLRLRPWPAAALAGAVCLLLGMWAGWFWRAGDPVSRLTAWAVAEHGEYVRGAKSRPASDPAALVTALRSQVDFPFEPVFQGDPEVQLIATMVSRPSGRRAATFVYRDTAGRYTTLFLMPGAGIAVPEGGRMSIETFKPHYRAASGRSLLLWKHRDLAWLLVSDLDRAHIPAMYLKVRKAANPPSASQPPGTA